MANPKAYGTAKEREYIQLLLADGYLEVIRAGASRSHHDKDVKGDFDLVARKPDHTLWVQVKAGQKKYVNQCRREWKPPSLPPYHVPRLAWFIRGQRGWYEQDGYDGNWRQRLKAGEPR